MKTFSFFYNLSIFLLAIVGGGISGCSSAYFFREIFGDKVELALFEQSDKIGNQLISDFSNVSF